jgi:hypothetical protein
MKVTLHQRKRSWRGGSGFTLVDAIFAMAVAGVMFLALYAGLAFGFRIIKLSRENVPGDQIMLEKDGNHPALYVDPDQQQRRIPTNQSLEPYY